VTEPADEEGVARAMMRKANRRMGVARIFLYLALVGQVPATVGVISPGNDVSDEMQLAFLVLVGVTFAVIVAAILFLDRHPFPATVSLAALHTLPLLFVLVSGDLDWPPSAPLIRSLFWVPYFWILVIPAFHLDRLASAHPDLPISRRMRGEAPPEGSSYAARDFEKHRAFKRKERQVLLVFGMVLALILGARFAGLYS
jgi:hypothetical protein